MFAVPAEGRGVTTLAEHVKPELCIQCGYKHGASIYWTPARMVDAVLAHVEKHNRIPTAYEWRNGTPNHPPQSRILRVFRSWNDLIVAAGFDPRTHRGSVWTKEAIVEAMLDELAVAGRWPRAREWHTRPAPGATPRPLYATVVRIFGSWGEAKKQAGWYGACPVCDKSFTLSRADKKFCSERCRGIAGRRARNGETVTAPGFRCVGCDGDEYSETIGCKSCWDRKRTRAYRAAVKNGAFHVSVVESPSSGDSCASQPGRAMAPVERPVDFSTETTAQAA